MRRAARLAAALTIGAGLALPACGGGSDYFEGLAAINDDIEDRYVAFSLESRLQLDSLPFAPAEGWHPDAARSAEQLLAELVQPANFGSTAVDIDLAMFGELREILVEADSRMAELEPQLEVTAIHDEIQAVCQEWADLLTRLISELEKARSSEELLAELGTLDLAARFDALHYRLDSNCVDLQAAAARADSTVNFGGAWVGGPSGEATTMDLICG